VPVITVDACAEYAFAAGFRGEGLITAVAVAGAESQPPYNTTSHNPDASTGDDSYGLWQINMLGSLGPARRKQFGLSRNDQLFDPATNARAAYSISSGGSNWSPWTTYKNGKHRPFLDRARAAADAVSRRGGAAIAAGAQPVSASQPAVIAGEVLPHGGSISDVSGVSSLFPGVQLTGVSTADADKIRRMGISGQVSLSIAETAQIELTYADPRGSIETWQRFVSLTTARLGDLDMQVNSVGFGAQSGLEVLAVTLRPRTVEKMRQPDLNKSRTWADLSPTEVLNERARAASMRFYGKGTARRSQIVQLGRDDATGQQAETDWDLGQRLAREEGFWFFESAGALYFAPPTWLLGKGTVVQARYRSPQHQWNVLDVPDAKLTVDEVINTRAFSRVIRLKLPRWRGEQVRPGMTCQFDGLPMFSTKLFEKGPALYIVTDVSWPLDGGIAPVDVEIMEAIDPVPQPPPPDVTVTDATGPAGAAPSASAPAGGNVSNQGKGSYGWQYDAPGGTASGPQPGAIVLRDHLKSRYNFIGTTGIYADRNVNGTSSKSAHAEGRAVDLHVPLSSVQGSQLAAYCVSYASRLGVQYIIWNKRSWKATDNPRDWKTYRPPNGKTDATSEHRDHVHVELCWEAARYLNHDAIKGIGVGP